MVTHKADVAVVGGGIAGLAHAYVAARAGSSVVLFERSQQAAGASIRNFGLLWPIGQPHGPMLSMALRSRDIWRDVLAGSRLPCFETGSLHLTYRDDEEAVAREFAAKGPELGYRCSWITPDEAARRAPNVDPDGLRGALWSETEITVDPRLIVARLPEWLAAEFGVVLRYGHAVRSIGFPAVRTASETWEAGRVIVCSGDDFETLFPEHHRNSGIVRCKLQMMRTQPQPDGWGLGPALAAGLTLRFYPSFRICESLAAYRERVASETPHYERWGIHVMASQTPGREVTIGDSHEYGNHVDIFNRDEIDSAILHYLRGFLRLPNERIAQRWYGVYAKHTEKPFVRFEPEAGVTVVTALGGAGMTLSFGLAEDTWNRIQA
ncbi:MAG: TIGR03364 family FAD-dependent oxidoreductase [Bryobacteraceae bacterium]